MVKKKFSGQTVAIIILAILLLISIAFGGVYAFYSARSNKVYGNIVMANLKINLGKDATTGASQFVISNNNNIVPGQPLTNTALTIENLSSVNIYLVVVYKVSAIRVVWNENDEPVKDENGVEITEPVVDKFKQSVFGIGVEYINPLFEDCNLTKNVTRTEWVDYVYKARDNDDNASEVILKEATETSPAETCKAYRCLVSTVSFPRTTDKLIEVIPENKMSLSVAMNNDFQRTSISFTLQAYAIAATTSFGFEENETKEGMCKKIVDLVYESQEFSFLSL